MAEKMVKKDFLLEEGGRVKNYGFAKNMVLTFNRDCCKNLKPKDINGKSDPFVKVYLNETIKERYVNRTRVIVNELNPVFKHTFHIPVYSLRDDIINVEIFDYDKVSMCDSIGKLEFKISSLDYGIVKDNWYDLNNGSIHLIIHLSDHNKPAFVTEPFTPLYLNVKIFEVQDKVSTKKCVSVYMKDDIFPFLEKNHV